MQRPIAAHGPGLRMPVFCPLARRGTTMFGMWSRASFALVFVGTLTVLSGCATSFTGDSHVPGGASGCQSACSAQGLELVGMVLMGEYSDGCICKVRGRSGATSQDEQLAVGAGPAAVGVVMAMRARDQQQRQMQQTQMAH